MAERVLVTGAQGLLGRSVVAAFLSTDPCPTVVGVGRSERLDDSFTYDLAWCGERVMAPLPTALHWTSSHPSYRYRRVDLCDRAAVMDVLREVQPDLVVHTAAALRDEPWSRLVALNLDAVVNLMEALGLAGRATVVAVSSGSVYGRTAPADLPHREGDPCEPLDLYAASKRAAEDVARILGDRHGMPVIQARVFNLIGAGLQDRHLAAHVAGQVAAMRRGLAPPVLRVGPLTSTRDFVSVSDAAAAAVALADRGEPGIYNVASGVELPVKAVVDGILRAGGVEGGVTVEELPGRPADLPRSYADVSRLRSLGWEPKQDVDAAIRELLDLYLFQLAPPGLSGRSST